ncbi:unnamed protein product, partial [Amoebophrya sp. A25]
LLYPLSFLWFPILVTTFGYEKKHGLLEMMRIQSLSNTVYWLASYAWFFGLFLLTMGGYFLLFYAVFSRSWDLGSMFLVTLLWGNAQIGLGLLVAAIFWRSESLTAVTYFVMSFGLVSTGDLLDAVEPPMPWTLVLFPMTNYGRSLVLTLKYSHETDSVNVWDEFTLSERNEFENLLIAQTLFGTFLIFFAIALLQDVHLMVWTPLSKAIVAFVNSISKQASKTKHGNGNGNMGTGGNVEQRESTVDALEMILNEADNADDD